ncbi:MAG TPA: glutathione synthase [Gammaproteobacteria bacterium]|jgi:glutathione synthase|nr:glutathione synthase [Gammaproteobacteria bacterium]
MDIKLGVVMDPIGAINFHKDSTLAMLLAAQKRGWSLHYMEQDDLYLEDCHCMARMAGLEVRAEETDWFTLGDYSTRPLTDLDVVLMRKDPPVDLEYLYTGFLLERAEAEGVMVVNRPVGVRNASEKLYTAWFSQCCAPMRVSRDKQVLEDFLREQSDIVVKPLNGMGGASVFRIRKDDPNLHVILETITDNGRQSAMAQRYIAEISRGDKRILMIDGEPFPHALARIPAAGETRGNLAAGGTGKGVDLSERDRWICAQVGPTLREQGLTFVGLDVIGDYLTEINVTSPTCIRELDNQYGTDIAGQLMDAIEIRLAAR